MENSEGSRYIDKLIEYANSRGYTVELGVTGLDCMGTIDYGGSWIQVGKHCEKNIVGVLAHELGHELGVRRSMYYYGHHSLSNKRVIAEIDAYRWGWVILQRLGVSNDYIDKCWWRGFHSVEINDYIKKYGRKPIWIPRRKMIPDLSTKAKWWIGFGVIWMIFWGWIYLELNQVLSFISKWLS